MKFLHAISFIPSIVLERDGSKEAIWEIIVKLNLKNLIFGKELGYELYLLDSLCDNRVESGYFLTRLSIQKNLNEEAFIKAPNWLHLLFGKPKVTNIPVGALSVRGVAFQLTGILMVIFLPIGRLVDLTSLNFLQEYYVGIWLGCLGLGILLSLLLKKIIPFPNKF